MEGEKVVWELIRNGKEIVATLEQDAEDLRVNGRGYPLSWIVPEEHAEAAFWCGEWDEEGYNYHLDNGDTYLVRYYGCLSKGSPLRYSHFWFMGSGRSRSNPVPDNRKE